MRTPNAGWYMAFGLGALIVTLMMLPPFVGETVRGYLMQGFAAVCHQLPGRSPHVDGVQLAVCHRCFGIYWGLPIAAVAFLAVRREVRFGARGPWLLGLALVPMLIDWSGDVLGVFSNTPGTRMATGLVFGLVAGLFLVLAFVDVRSATSIAEPPVESEGRPTYH